MVTRTVGAEGAGCNSLRPSACSAQGLWIHDDSIAAGSAGNFLVCSLRTDTVSRSSSFTDPLYGPAPLRSETGESKLSAVSFPCPGWACTVGPRSCDTEERCVVCVDWADSLLGAYSATGSRVERGSAAPPGVLRRLSRAGHCETGPVSPAPPGAIFTAGEDGLFSTSPWGTG